MSYIRVKLIGGKGYKYLVVGKRIEGKVLQKVVKYLGAVNPIYKVGCKRKPNASKYVRPLTNIEEKSLKKAVKSTDTFIRDRAKIILLSSKRFFSKQISEKIGCDVRKVRNAIGGFNLRGLSALVRGKAKGAKPKFTKELRARILEVASTDPLKLGLHFTTWSLPKLRHYLIDKGMINRICVESVRTILRRENTKWRKSRRWQYSNDPEFAKKNLQKTH